MASLCVRAHDEAIFGAPGTGGNSRVKVPNAP